MPWSPTTQEILSAIPRFICNRPRSPEHEPILPSDLRGLRTSEVFRDLGGLSVPRLQLNHHLAV